MTESLHPHWPGWRCTRQRPHTGPCALRARWWNLSAQWLSLRLALR